MGADMDRDRIAHLLAHLLNPSVLACMTLSLLVLGEVGEHIAQGRNLV